VLRFNLENGVVKMEIKENLDAKNDWRFIPNSALLPIQYFGDDFIKRTLHDKCLKFIVTKVFRIGQEFIIFRPTNGTYGGRHFVLHMNSFQLFPDLNILKWPSGKDDDPHAFFSDIENLEKEAVNYNLLRKLTRMFDKFINEECDVNNTIQEYSFDVLFIHMKFGREKRATLVWDGEEINNYFGDVLWQFGLVLMFTHGGTHLSINRMYSNFES
jgi:hypothetical protein